MPCKYGYYATSLEFGYQNPKYKFFMLLRMPSTKLGSLVTILLYRGRASSSSSGHWLSTLSTPLGLKHAVGMSKFGAADGYSTSIYHHQTHRIEEDKNKKAEVQSSALPSPPGHAISTWAKWIVGSIFSLIIPFLKQKWDNLLMLEGKMEKGVEEAEYVAEVVEKVANRTEKVSAEVANKLPGNCKLKETALAVEHISTIVASDAQLAQNIIHKANDLKREVEEVEKMVEPIIDGIVEVKHG